ncbi:hypothetical protein [Cognatishimia sp.]|uniref:hypothetical protein n=1 Tax=Cognatishimia sp. TaxID=2211648 RepID=UPI0035188C35|nr:hypothetical protein [Cognatishimia sp.]
MRKAVRNDYLQGVSKYTKKIYPVIAQERHGIVGLGPRYNFGILLPQNLIFPDQSWEVQEKTKDYLWFCDLGEIKPEDFPMSITDVRGLSGSRYDPSKGLNAIAYVEFMKHGNFIFEHNFNEYGESFWDNAQED